MTTSDWEESKGIGSTGSEAAPKQAIAAARLRSCWTRLLIVGLAATVVGSAKAQEQQPDQTLVVTTQAAAPAQTPARAQAAPSPNESTSKTAGDYTVQQSIEFGYRDSLINGNLNNYDTFENLTSGVRLFDYSVDMRSIDHKGPFFDNLSFINSGYGGDPNDISRLHVDKSNLYDFRVMFRQDKNYWNYNLLANPLNPTTGPIPGESIVNSPHALDLTRKMQDYDLTLFPLSRLRFRVGYSRNADSGPQSTTLEGGTEPLLNEMMNEVTNSYRLGVDYRGLPKTTLSFDELLTYTAINNRVTDNDFGYQLTNGMPVDLGIVSVGTSPCTSASITPPVASSTCNAYTAYSQVQNPRSSFPVERFSFQSSYLKNFVTSGSVSYSESKNTISDFDENIAGWSSRTLAAGSTTGGPAWADRVSTSANWSGDYSVTSKLGLVDQFLYDDFRIPALWATAETNIFDEPNPAALAGMLRLPFYPTANNLANFATLCPSPFTGLNCPQHSSSSGADVTGELASRFLGQNRRSNTFEVKYDFTRRLSAYAGYEFTARTIQDFSATWDVGEIYLPGGAGGTAGLHEGGLATGNYYFAARGDCAALSTGNLPAACTLNPNGSIQEGSSTNLIPEAANESVRNVYEIHEQAGVFGLTARPMDTLRINADFLLGYNDNSFTRISPRQVQSYKVHARYNPKPWASLDASVDINENRDNVYQVNNIEHGRTYSAVATLSPIPTFWIDFGYSYVDIYTQTEICFADTGSTVFTAANSPCPIAASVAAGVTLGTLSYYASRDNYAYVDTMWKPQKRVTAMLGYGGSVVRGSTTFLNALTPTGTLDFTYLKPFVSVAFDLYKGLSYKTTWNYFGYDTHGAANPILLEPLPSQDFNGSNVTFSFRYLF
jgi:hypothetical protein